MQPDTRRGLVDQVNRLVRQEAIRDIAAYATRVWCILQTGKGTYGLERDVVLTTEGTHGVEKGVVFTSKGTSGVERGVVFTSTGRTGLGGKTNILDHLEQGTTKPIYSGFLRKTTAIGIHMSIYTKARILPGAVKWGSRFMCKTHMLLVASSLHFAACWLRRQAISNHTHKNASGSKQNSQYFIPVAEQLTTSYRLPSNSRLHTGCLAIHDFIPVA